MNRIVISGAVVVLSVATALGQGHGRRVFKPGETTGPDQGRVERRQYDRSVKVSRSDYVRTPGGGHVGMTPIALTMLNWGMPYGRDWAICGLRLNLGLPGITHPYESVYGLDAGLSGETYGESGGLIVNVFNNTAREMYGIAVAGLWNRSLGMHSIALQVAPAFNSAEGLEGVQIGIVNRAHDFHGVQIGIYNLAAYGGGLQIGLWNDNGNGVGSPIIGIVY